MGCTYSTVEVGEVLGRCKERRRLMKQLMKCQADLAAAVIAYLQSLRKTGATLRRLTEVESSISGVDPPVGPTVQPSPPRPASLPPSPPPPPNFLRVAQKESTKTKFYVEDPSDMDDDDDEILPPPPPPFLIPGWNFGEHMGSTPSSDSSSPMRSGGAGATAPEDDWAEPKSEFGGEEEVVEEYEEEVLIQRKEALTVAMNWARETYPSKELADDNLSTVSKFTKDTDPAATVSRSKRTWAEIAIELEECFLKAAAGGKDVTVLLEPNRSYVQPGDPETKKGKSFKSAKVVHVLSWSWSFRSSHSNRDTQDVNNSSMSATHGTTLEKILSEEQKLYNQVKDEENIKSQHKKMLLFVDKLQGGDHDWSKIETTSSDVEELQCRIISLQESINETCLSISKLRDEELFPQLVRLCGGLAKMWRTMYECHQEQDHASQQANHLDNSLGNGPTTDSHYAISQLEAAVTSWYTTFCNLFRCQREYIHALNQWVKLTDCLPETNNSMGSTSSIHDFCVEVQGVLDRPSDKAAAEAIKNFSLVLRSIIRQHTEEHNLQKSSDRLQSRLAKEMVSFQTLEKDNQHAKLEALKKKAEEEKVKHLNSVRKSRAMMLNNLQTSLPNVFQTLMVFSSNCVQALNDITSPMGVVASFPQCSSPVH